MKSISLIKFLIAFVVVCSSVNVYAQQPVKDTGTKTQIYIIQAKRLNYEKRADSSEYQSAVGNVILRQDLTLFYCDSVVLNKSKNMLEAFGHVHINDNDSVHTYADYLRYEGNIKKAFLKKNVKLTDGKGVLTTPELEYDVTTKTGTYYKSGKVVNGKTVLTSDEGYYYGDTRDVYFKKNVLLNSPDYTITTDTLLYNANTDVATFIVPTVIKSGNNRKVLTSDGYYDLKNKKAYFGKRSQIQDSTTFLIADEVASDETTGFGEARGTVIYKDTAQGVTILANNLKSNKKEGSFLATEKPVMILRQDKDSIYIAADTLYSARLSDLKKTRIVPVITDSTPLAIDTLNAKDSSRDRFVEAYSHVKIFSDSLQAIGDSLFYASDDSVFRLFKNPVVWAQQSQITGDTIYLYTANKKPKRLYVFENALSIQKVDVNYYNQVKGRTINGDFVNGDIEHLRAKGNAESVYYGQDEDNKYVGVNRASSDIIDMYFANKEAQRVVFRSSLSGTSYPMGQVDHNELRLRGFLWHEDIRPKTKYDLFGN